MTRPEPEREPQSETPEKDEITKTHEEFIGDKPRPSLSKQEYERKKEAEKRSSGEKKAGRSGEGGSTEPP